MGTNKPLPESLKFVLWRRVIIAKQWVSDRPLETDTNLKRLRVGLDLVDVGDKIHVFWLDERFAVVQSGADVQHREEGEGEIIRDKGFR